LRLGGETLFIPDFAEFSLLRRVFHPIRHRIRVTSGKNGVASSVFCP
jgi:hypothetical protein